MSCTVNDNTSKQNETVSKSWKTLICLYMYIYDVLYMYIHVSIFTL